MSDGQFEILLFVSLSFLPMTAVHGGDIAPPFYGLDRPSLDYELPPLQFGFDELEPYLEESSVRSHYFDFHNKYIEETNSLLKKWRRHAAKGKHYLRMSIIEIVRNVSLIPMKFKNDLKNFGSGYVNHNLYWSVISPNAYGELRIPQGALAEEITSKFGSFVEFKNTFTNMAVHFFGSGYVWLCRNHSTSENTGELVIVSSHNEECPLSSGLYPILGIDVWEHAYLTTSHRDKEKYVDNWWFLVDWKQVVALGDWWKKLKFHDEL